MGGRPVWLASVSLRRHERIVPTGDWTPAQLADVERQMDVLLDGVGDPSRERCFRMCITLCRHRAVTDDEFRALPDEWFDTPARDLAGGPLEVLWSRGTEDRPSTLPCHSPGRNYIDPTDRRLWLPVDCEQCPPCLDRLSTRDRQLARPEAEEAACPGT